VDDQEFYEHLNRVSAAVTWEGHEALPGQGEVDRLRLVLTELANDPSTASDRERLAALQAVYSQVGRLAELASEGR
jgi:hypothetical protein